MRNLESAEGSIFTPISEAVPDGLVVVDSEGRIREANHRVTELFGYAHDRLLGEPIELLVPDEVSEEHVAYRDGYIAEPESRPMGVGLDLVGQRRDGSTFPVLVGLNPVELDGEEAVLAAIRDISEHEALQAKYRAVLESAPDAFFIADAASGQLREVNSRAAALLGYDAAELVGMHQSDLHPDGRETDYRELFEDHVQNQGPRVELPDGSPIYVETSDGTRVPVEINGWRFSVGDRDLMAGVFRDVSQRRERERELERTETIIEATGDAVYMLDPEGHFTFVNEALEELVGYEVDELLGEHVSTVMRESDVEVGNALIGRLLSNDRTREIFEIEAQPAEGEPVPLEVHLAVLEDEEGMLEASVGVARNISDRKARERQLERENERLEEFAGIIAHDLRNPLNVADGNVQLATEECQSEHLETAASAHQRMFEIIEDTLTLARGGKTVGETTEVDIGALATTCLQHVSAREADLSIDGAPTVSADRSRLRNLFENLFRNVCEHAGPDVEVAVGPLEDGFYVEDSGPGIPEEHREEVFEAGYSSADGAGLGLSIVKRIVEAHGWDLTVGESAEGGARFEVNGVDVHSEESTDDG